MKLQTSSYDWARRHLREEGDSDLFPTPFELDAIEHNWSVVLNDLRPTDLESYAWNPGRRFLIPKDFLAFRAATQLDPKDSLVLAAVIYEFGAQIESRRLPTESKRVFSYRFAPTSDGRLYGSDSNWGSFWHASLGRARTLSQSGHVAVADITDYYNQIYHHPVENELVATGVSEQVSSSIIHFLGACSHGVSRGLPVGPHAVHLLAECAMNPIDRSLLSHGLDFCRYVDDVHFFCNSKEEAEFAIYEFAEILDKHQRLTLQKHKTKTLTVEEFISMAESNLLDSPLNEDEAVIIETIKRHSGDVGPYAIIALEGLEDEELAALTEEKVEPLLQLYLETSPTPFSRMGWLLRRLSQVGTPAALKFVVSNLDRLTPVLGDVAKYIVRGGKNYQGSLVELGEAALRALDLGCIARIEYLQIVLLDLFGRLPQLDHSARLTNMYDNARPSARRELVLAAAAAQDTHWIRERKDEFSVADPWLRRAILAATQALPGDEGRVWRRRVRGNLSPMEKWVAAWAER